MNSSKVMLSEGLNLHIPRKRLVYGLLLFAATWGILPIVWICFAYQIPHGHLWLEVLGNGVLFFLPGLVIASLFFGCLRLSLRWRGNRGNWLIPSFVVSFVLCTLEMILTGGQVEAIACQVIGLIISCLLSSAYWLRSSRRAGGAVQ